MPLAPAVGAATMRPMQAFTSTVAIAMAAPSSMFFPEKEGVCAAEYSRDASPPIKPPSDFCG